MPKAEFKEQQKYLWSLVRKAGWDKAVPGQNYSRFAAYLLKNFQVTHMNVLDEKQMRQAIATLRPYAAKAAHLQKKKLHAAVMSHVARKGKNVDWLHQNMIQWGYGDSLRACSYQEVSQIFTLVKKALP
jgi:beta-glucosidase/6-phospho-beta-glucosidase/beta-galactosidase